MQKVGTWMRLQLIHHFIQYISHYVYHFHCIILPDIQILSIQIPDIGLLSYN